MWRRRTVQPSDINADFCSRLLLFARSKTQPIELQLPLDRDVLHVASSLTMRTAGIREARQNLSALVDEVKKGREVVIQDRGKPVARLIPYRARSSKPFPNLKQFRRSLKTGGVPLSTAIIEERDEGAF
jgi:prevent-host-death family protein